METPQYTLDETTLTLRDDVVLWSLRYSLTASSGGSVDLTAEVPGNIKQYTVFGLHNVEVLSTQFTTRRNLTAAFMNGGGIESIEVKSSNTGDSVITKGGMKRHLNPRYWVWDEHDTKGHLTMTVRLPDAVTQQGSPPYGVTVAGLLPRMPWTWAYHMVFLETPAFDLASGYNGVRASLSRVYTVDASDLESPHKKATVVLQEGNMIYGASSSHGPARASRRMMAQVSMDSGHDRGNVSAPPAQVFRNISLDPGTVITRHVGLDDIRLPFKRIYDHKRDSGAILEVLYVDYDSLERGLAVPFRVNPAPSTIVNSSGRLMASDVKPRETVGVVELSSLSGVSVKRDTTMQKTHGQRRERVRLTFDSRLDDPVPVELWEKGAAKMEIVKTLRVNVRASPMSAKPSEDDAVVVFPLLVPAGESTLTYDLSFYIK